MDVEAYRATYRATAIPADYRGARNVRQNVATCLGLFVASVVVVGRPSWLALGSLAAALLTFDFVEYAFHRWISHHRWPALQASYRRHTAQHHGFFDHRHMASNQLRDYHVTVMPTVTIVVYYVLFFFLFAAPLWLIAGRGAAFAFSAGIALSLLQLDVLHYYYHLDPNARLCRVLDRFACFRGLKWRHGAHHDPRRMRHEGFNLTFPLFDWVFGTLGKRNEYGP